MASGILYVDKPAGLTSRALDNAVQKLFHTKKVGHLGTLDPFATGLLIVAVNQGTKSLAYLPDEEKTYQATLFLGKKTSTGDPDGDEIETKEVPSLTIEKIEEALSSFLGASTQLPPMTSAIKKDGIALYELAHRGETVERERRNIFIHDIRLLSYEGNILSFEATVSKGTYIRVLGEDIAEKLGTVGYLTSLRRVKVGDIRVEEAKPLDQIEESSLLDPSFAIALPHVEVDEAKEKDIRNGKAMSLDREEEKILFTRGGKALAVYKKKEKGLYLAERGLF